MSRQPRWVFTLAAALLLAGGLPPLVLVASFLGVPGFELFMTWVYPIVMIVALVLVVYTVVAVWKDQKRVRAARRAGHEPREPGTTPGS